MEFDGVLVSELGVKKYLIGYNAKSMANLPIMERQSFYDKAWTECNLGCHGPSYRRHEKLTNFKRFISDINSISPVAAGLVDGAYSSTFKQVGLIAGGANRTGEGLGLAGKQKFFLVGSENLAGLDLLSNIFNKVISTEIDFIDNPISKLVMAIIYEYIGLVPESILEKMLEDGAFKIDSEIDEEFIYKMIADGVITGLSRVDVEAAISALNNPAKKIIAKQVGKKLGVALAVIVAERITKKLMKSSAATWRIKKHLVEFRKTARGSAPGVLLGLLKAQGWADLAASESRALQASCPKFWDILRYKLGGADLLYFAVKEITCEYVDRISLIEKDPATYLSLMAALVNSGKTNEVLFPR